MTTHARFGLLPALHPATVAGRSILLFALAAYTVFAAGPIVWVGLMSVRTTSEISAAPYAWPTVWHWHKFYSAWVDSAFGDYFTNSLICVLSAVAITNVVGALAAHALARFRFPGNRIIYFLLFSTIIFPPQVTMIALFQNLVDFGLFDTRTGLILVYVSVQLPLTIYLLESFFARLPQDLFDAARMDGYSEWAIFWRITFPVGAPAVATTVILNLITLWNEFLYAVVLISDDSKRTLPLGIMKFLGDRSEDIGMVATGVVISLAPVVILYALFSERLVRGMTAGAIK